MSWEPGEMPTSLPASTRSELGFVEAVRSAFSFLEQMGLRLVHEEPTLVRFESTHRFVNVFQGRGSYELGVEFGRWVELEGERVEQRFPLADLVRLHQGSSPARFRSLTALSKEQVQAFVAELAAWAQQVVDGVLSDDSVFERLSAQAALYSQHFQQEGRAAQLRKRAEDAWGKGDLRTVVLAYREILDELPMIELRRSELARIHYAERRVAGEAQVE